ncbi:hypothetical protein BDA99DRAFT_327296 [Phascolomyces articulosus]|uniref:Uncharacterized protein n=1 Tax=Phascolomyces articulosus TaxID=60185 RepID=A0AAD5KHE4_9FUNG|nr:hypothetical protein BDA99DRAFT_327296 [Phascolomyces articulosus]
MRWPWSTSTVYTSLNQFAARARRKPHILIFNIVKLAALIVIPTAITFFIIFRVDTHARIYFRDWLTQEEPIVIEPLSHDGTCFKNLPVEYQNGQYLHHYNFIPGHRLQDDTCFGFASTVRPSSKVTPVDADQEDIVFHTHFTEKKFGPTQLATVKSFLATQNDTSTRLIVWQGSDQESLLSSSYWQQVENDPRVTIQVVDNTNNDLEILPLVALNQYGGVWFEPSTFFVRELTPLMELDWIAQGDCFTSVEGNPFVQTGMLHFRQDSPFMCEMVAEAREMQRAKKKVDLSKLYYRIYQRVLRNGVKPWMVLPWCYTAPSRCKQSNSLQSPFTRGEKVNRIWLDSIFAYYWRDPSPDDPSGEIFELLQSKHNV